MSFTKIDNSVVDRVNEIGITAFSVYVILAKHADNEDRTCWPSMSRIATITGITPRSARRAIVALQGAGLITAKRQSEKGKGCISNLYTIFTLTPQEPSERNDSSIGTKSQYPSDKNDSSHRTAEHQELDSIRTRPKGTRRGQAACVHPTIEEIKTYCSERKNQVDVQAFIDYYESNGWMVGRNPMKNWKAAIRNWERSGEKALNGFPHVPVDVPFKEY